MKPTIVIIHGAYGSPKENWFPWLRAELEGRGFKVMAPKFPTPEGQNLESWLQVMESAVGRREEKIIIVGHSIGCAFALQYIARTENRIIGAVLVAGFAGKLGKKIFDSLNESFLKGFDWSKIREKCPRFFVYHSDNDPYVPLGFGEELAGNLGAKLSVVRGAGHFNRESGYHEFKLLLDDLLNFLGDGR